MLAGFFAGIWVNFPVPVTTFGHVSVVTHTAHRDVGDCTVTESKCKGGGKESVARAVEQSADVFANAARLRCKTMLNTSGSFSKQQGN